MPVSIFPNLYLVLLSSLHQETYDPSPKHYLWVILEKEKKKCNWSVLYYPHNNFVYCTTEETMMCVPSVWESQQNCFEPTILFWGHGSVAPSLYDALKAGINSLFLLIGTLLLSLSLCSSLVTYSSVIGKMRYKASTNLPSQKVTWENNAGVLTEKHSDARESQRQQEKRKMQFF